MKTSRVCGWAVIFTVTLLLAACATQPSKVAQTDITSGPDATITQPTTQMFEEDSAIFVSQDWLDERERAVEERELEVARRENALVVDRAWQQEHERLLNARTQNLDRRENALAINQAWLNERETRLAQQVPDLTKREDMLAFRGSFADEEALVAGLSLEGDVGETAISEQGGRCYASVYIPAQYRTVAVTKPIEVPKGENLPQLYQTVTEQVKISDESISTEEVLCEDKMTMCRIMEVQRSLYRGGYSPGPIDGILGRQTMAAVNAFQKDFNLTVANYLTVETVRTLDANF